MNPKKLYGFNAYDEHFNLKVPIAIRFAILFGIKNLFLIFLAFNPSQRLSGSGIGLFKDIVNPWILFSDLFAAIVLLSWIKRDIKAGELWRKLWLHGRELLLISYFYHILYVSFFLITSTRIDESLGWFSLLMVLIDILVIRYLIISPIATDLFRDFPAKN
ncbi:DUF2919 family protein [Ectothiorhodospiraceae bacterium BW-2]|nr:DUF2919 family protein [Ectothiorhodospiraceae bacterium BW-2]